jgi:transglutaminase-like putative cysteine protease
MLQPEEDTGMPKPQTVEEVVEQVTAGAGSEVEKAVALHDYVRDSVEFGFNMYFDAAPPEYTLACGRGHCNPKSRLAREGRSLGYGIRTGFGR